MRLTAVLMLCAIFFNLQGCISTPLKIETTPIAPNEKALGEVSGTGTGILLLSVIPIRQNSRFKRAYDQAIQTHPGTIRLVDPIIEEQWFWGVILNGFIFKVTGTAVGQK